MTQQVAIDLVREALLTAMWMALPLLGILFLFGILISLLQTLFSIQDPSFGAVPRLATMLVTFLVALPWMISHLVTYTRQLILHLSKYAN